MNRCVLVLWGSWIALTSVGCRKTVESTAPSANVNHEASASVSQDGRPVGDATMLKGIPGATSTDLPKGGNIEGTGSMLKDQQPIGSATMSDDGAIVMDLRAAGPHGEVGMARVVYPPTHPRYQEILAHLGGMKPGDKKLVLPFPE